MRHFLFGDCHMDKMIAFCGINCNECKALIATQKNDKAMRKAVDEEWSMKARANLVTKKFFKFNFYI